MKLILRGHDDLYAVEQLQLSLFPDREGTAVSSLGRGKVWLTAAATVTVGDKTTRCAKRIRLSEETVRLRRKLLQQCYYKAALPHLDTVPPWGALSGVRPTKLTTRHLLEGGTSLSAYRQMQEDYFVTPERARLSVACSASTVAACKQQTENDISLYVGIPFCPTRCAYCSFVSRSIGKRTELLDPYLQALYKELALTGQLLKDSGKRVRTVYIGGGTPTTLSAEQLAELLDRIYESIDLSGCLEFTVEGGRPDTLDAQKLLTIRQHGADRMSINPQSMVDSVLRASGRPHTGDDVLRSYEQAVAAGFTAINMDLIAGLPTDTYEGFCYSLDKVASLRPANITVHTLALKKGADLFERQVALPSGQEVSRMVEYAGKTLTMGGFRPYYLYRQKYMSGSFENIGWSRDGLDCLYNIYMMEEIHTILSLGGGGMNKVNLPNGRLERFHNPKFPEQYIDQLESVLEQKKTLFRLL